ncbi:MAG: HINT domain-containing protein, partial [Planctomycetaceae bacterium]|nr:HINT domain-containing protein [Planctomycetaceae bacterium]
KILAIERCPEIRAGPGRVVLTTVNHLSRGVCDLTYKNSTGQNETIRPTSSHRFYSLDRKDWIHIGDANSGEKLQGFNNDIITVISCQPLDKTKRVYNMTVEDDHVYHVGKLNLLAHNIGCLTYIDEQSGWVSPQKLSYGMDKNEYKIHVLKHTPGGWHGINDTVFNLEKDADVFALLDEAWQRRGLGKKLPRGRIEYTINMGKIIGTKGEKKICMIIEQATYNDHFSVVTAFPIK